jgi:uncharacterized protein (TIGR02246 family)
MSCRGRRFSGTLIPKEEYPMRFRLMMLGVTLAAVLAAAATHAAEGVESVDQAWAKAMKANDLAGVLACYAPDAVAWFPDEPEARGAAAIRKAYEQLFADNTVKDAVVAETHYKTAGDFGAGWGTFTLTLEPKKGGAPVTLKGRFTEIAERRSGRWVYVVDHASGEPAPPAPGPNR